VTEAELVDENLRACFRALASERDASLVRIVSGIELISLGVRFQMFNGAFLSGPVLSEGELERRAISADLHFGKAGLKWSFWLCDSFLQPGAVRRAGEAFARHDLRCATEMPGMIALALPPAGHPLPDCEPRPTDRGAVLQEFREIGSSCFRVPLDWFSEVFDQRGTARTKFRAWVGYADGKAVATAATVVSAGAIGLYNLATLPEYRSRGYGESLMRQCIAEEIREHGNRPIVLQSTRSGLSLYKRLGFRTVTRFRVFVR
jgi:GNAT superfamily N-acetyltransferase